MKVQTLADFIARMDPVPKALDLTMEGWQIQEDGACGVGGSRIGIVMQVQVGIKLWYIESSPSNTINNVSEYEAMIMALRIIKEVGI